MWPRLADFRYPVFNQFLMVAVETRNRRADSSIEIPAVSTSPKRSTCSVFFTIFVVRLCEWRILAFFLSQRIVCRRRQFIETFGISLQLVAGKSIFFRHYSLSNGNIPNAGPKIADVGIFPKIIPHISLLPLSLTGIFNVFMSKFKKYAE